MTDARVGAGAALGRSARQLTIAKNCHKAKLKTQKQAGRPEGKDNTLNVECRASGKKFYGNDNNDESNNNNKIINVKSARSTSAGAKWSPLLWAVGSCQCKCFNLASLPTFVIC